MKFPFAHRIIRPQPYVSSAATDVGATIRKAKLALKQEQKDREEQDAKVQPIKKLREAA